MAFSWEEMVGESPMQRPSQEDRDLSRASLVEHEDGFIPLPDYRSYQETDTWTPPYFSDNYGDLRTTANHLRNSSTAARLPLSAPSRRRYSSPAINSLDEPESTLPPYRMPVEYTKEFARIESLRRPDQVSGDEPVANTTLPTLSPNRLPSIRDKISVLDPRITSPKFGTIRTWPLSKPNNNVSAVYTTEKSDSSERAQSSVASEISESRSHEFVLETFNTSSGSMESRRGKRRGKLSESSASSASRLRSIGACWKCKLQKNQCSTDDPCGPCRKLLEARRYCPPCFRGPLVELTSSIFWGKDPMPGNVSAWGFSRALQPGARNLLNVMKDKNDDILETALRLYESESVFEILGLCDNVLHNLEVSLNKSKHLSSAQFFAICVLDMVCRRSEMATTHLSSVTENDDIQGITYPSPGMFFRRSKTLEVLFGLIRPTSTYNPFEAISKATGSKKYDRKQDGTDLHSYVESCLFKLKLLNPRPPQDLKSLQIHLPLASSKRSTTFASDLPDRSTLGGGRKRGLSAESESHGQESRAASRQRMPVTGQHTQDLNESTESTNKD